jgi:site-specific DNA recombinase
MEKNKTRFAIYLRVSTEDQVDWYGIPLQRDAIRNYIDARYKLPDGSPSYEIVTEYIDEGISGTKTWEERPAFSEMMKDIMYAPNGDKPFDVVIAYRIDRFARKLKILLNIVDFLNEKEIWMASVNEAIDTTTPFGNAILNIMWVIAELEIETFKERSKGGKAQARKQWVFMGPNTPYGYMKDANWRLAILDEEKDVVELIFRLFTLDGLSRSQIANYLTENHIITPGVSAVKYGKRRWGDNRKNHATFWREGQITDILENENYIGRVYEKSKNGKPLSKSDWILVPYRHPSIVSEDVFYRTQKKMEETKYMIREKKKTEQEHTYILSGLLKCNCCYHPEEWDRDRYTLIGDKKKVAWNKFSHYYKCGRKNPKKTSLDCLSLPLPADTLEEYVVSFVKELLKDPKLVYDYQNSLRESKDQLLRDRKSLASIENLYNALPEKKENLLWQQGEGIIGRDELKEKLEDLKKQKEAYLVRITELQNKISKNTLSEGYLSGITEFSEKYATALNDITQNREEVAMILRMIVDSIVVSTRPVNKDDVIAGRKKEWQQIPESIHIKLKLPSEIIANLHREFLVNDSKWWTDRGSNPGPKD